MLLATPGAPNRRTRRAELNRSSRTKTSREDRKKDKEAASVSQFEFKIKRMMESDELLLPKLFDDEVIESILGENSSAQKPRRRRVYTVPTTLSLFVQQVLMKERGCKEVVLLLNRKRQGEQLRPVSTNTTSYCDARARIPLFLMRTLVDRTARLASGKLEDDQLWRGRRVLLVDGLVVSAPDTPENQNVYPQPHSQKPGLGFPQLRAVAAICLATGVITDMQYGPVEGKKTGEATLFRQMFSGFQPGELIVSDSNFECFRDLQRSKRRVWI